MNAALAAVLAVCAAADPAGAPAPDSPCAPLVAADNGAHDLVQQEKYAAAAALLRSTVAALKPEVVKKCNVEDSLNAAKTLESWAKLAEGKDTASLKSLMRERLQGRSWGPTEELRDADIPTWVGSLKRIDKDAAQFFSRSVKVVITAPDWPAVEVQLACDGIVQALKEVGLKAAPPTGGDTFTIQVGPSKDSTGEAFGSHMYSASLAARGTWVDSTGAAVLAPVDLSVRAPSQLAASEARQKALVGLQRKTVRTLVLKWLEEHK